MCRLLKIFFDEVGQTGNRFSMLNIYHVFVLSEVRACWRTVHHPQFVHSSLSVLVLYFEAFEEEFENVLHRMQFIEIAESSVPFPEAN